MPMLTVAALPMGGRADSSCRVADWVWSEVGVRAMAGTGLPEDYSKGARS